MYFIRDGCAVQVLPHVKVTWVAGNIGSIPEIVTETGNENPPEHTLFLQLSLRIKSTLLALGGNRSNGRLVRQGGG